MSDYKKVFHLKTILYSATALATFVLAPNSASAQVDNATGIADPSRIAKDLFHSDELPKIHKKLEVKTAAGQKAPSGAEKINFALDKLEIEGVGAYTADDLDPIYRDFLGTTVSLSDIYDIANQLTVKYRNDGYILTQVVVPPQTIEGGIVKVRVIEGFVDQIAIEGEANERTVRQIQKYADNLRVNNILDAKNLERYLLLINDLPGITARSVLSPSKAQTGGSDLTIIVERDVYEAEAYVNNHGSRYLGQAQLGYIGKMNSVFGLNEQITSQLVISGDNTRLDELLFGAISYEQPLSRFGSKLRLSGSITSTEPGYDLDQFDVKGQSKYLAATISHPFLRSRTTNFIGRATYDWRSVTSKNNLVPDTTRDKISSVRIGATAQFMDDFFGIGLNALDIEFSQGLDMMGASESGDANLTRSNGNPHYSKVNVQAQRLQNLIPSVNLLIAGKAQWAATPLLSSEEFGVGGTTFGRGYDSSEIVGEDGVAGKLELQWNDPYEIKYVNDIQLYSFWDAGRVWNQDATTSAGKRQSIASAGFGVRADVVEDTEAELSVAFPLTRDVDTREDTTARIYFSVKHKF